ncbi:hypothetical protein AB0F88_26090 [Streptosporangium sp. NPDC023963]|uniref:hypothetical protein n=1 Tax=Streptosporangium sp. NPDC023963 TaxID=3155608 RepID=UPI0034475E33
MSSKTVRPPRVPSRPDVRPSIRARHVIVAVVAAVAIAGPVGYLLGSPDASQVAIADMREAEKKRDVQQIGELTSTARVTAGELNGVLSKLAEVLPRDGEPGARSAEPAEVDGWRNVLRQAVERHAETPSGTTATNVARAGFRGAVDAMAVAVDTYAAGRGLPADLRQPFLELAARQRSAAVATWSVAATQLDQISVDAGNGHQHVYLTSAPGEGGMSADSVPEGTHG